MRFATRVLPVAVVKLIVFSFSEKLHEVVWSLVLYLVMQCTRKSGAVLAKLSLVFYLVMQCTSKKWCSTSKIILFLLNNDKWCSTLVQNSGSTRPSFTPESSTLTVSSCAKEKKELVVKVRYID
ncbi:hypothetical protein VPH35_082765 [Triticum aestivum]